MKRKLFVFLSILISLTACGETVVYSRKHSSSRTETAYVVPSESGQTASSSVKSTNVYSTTTGISEISTSGSGYSSQEGNYIYSDAQAIKVFDKSIDQEIYSNYRIYLREYDDPTFYAYRLGYLRQGNNTVTLHENDDVWALYIYDIDGDGYRDFAWVSKNPTTRLYEIYAHGMNPYKTLLLRNCERGDFSYFLKTDNENLYVKETTGEFADTETGYGKIVARDNHGYVEWLNTNSVIDFGFKVMIANKERTSVATWKDNGVTKFLGSSNCYYLVDLVVLAENDLTNVNLPISISGTMSFLPEPARVDGRYRYTVYFMNSIAGFYLDFTIFGITRRLQCGGTDESVEITCLRDYVDWAEELETYSIGGLIDVDCSSTEESGIVSVYEYNDQDSYAKFKQFIHYPFYEIDPNDFAIEHLPHRYYRVSIYKGNQGRGYKSYLYNDRFMKCDDRWFICGLKTNISFDTEKAAYSYLSFDEAYKTLDYYKVSDDTRSGSISTAGLYFKETGERADITKQKYYFVMGSSKYYITGEKTFCSQWGSTTYTITTSFKFTSY